VDQHLVTCSAIVWNTLLLLYSPLKSPYAHACCNMHTTENNKNAVREWVTHKRKTGCLIIQFGFSQE